MSANVRSSAPPSGRSRAQMEAADPAASVWVAANAGTGKTQVLTDRVLRLLLKGALPQRILCITYTNAAAAEMQNRIQGELGAWVGMEAQALAVHLTALTGEPAGEKLLKRARTLFARVLDAPDGIRIMTIHSFCQSVLRRFPLEAGVAPHFEVIAERTAQELLAESRQRLLAAAMRGDHSGLSRAVALLAGEMQESRFQSLLEMLAGQRVHLEEAWRSEPSGELRLLSRIAGMLDIRAEENEIDIIQRFERENSSSLSQLKQLINALELGGKPDKEQAQRLSVWFAVAQGEKVAKWPLFHAVWFVEGGGERKAFYTNDIKKKVPNIECLFRNMLAPVEEVQRHLQALALYRLAESCLIVSEFLLNIYSRLKEEHGAMDYDDLVLHTVRLFRHPGMAAWVLFKLDGGLDHLLIDEAQDTGPLQWELVERLVEEFFAGQGRHEGRPVSRTLFVVGDEKQSIYGFQGAIPEAFGGKKHAFARRAEQAGLRFASVPLGLSYRSTEAVLQAVDAVFNQENLRRAVTYGEEADIRHGAYREGEAGRVELWPPIAAVEKEESDPFLLGKMQENKSSPKVIMAERIAKIIRGWLDSSERLESRNRPIRAGDVLILVRTRGTFVPAMVRALKKLNVPVAGADRLQLAEHIAVQDLLALAEFLLLPEDDLSLACLLKSPLCGVDEETLFTLAHGRAGTPLWNRVREAAPPCLPMLERLMARADYARPFELFSQVLEQEGGRHRFAARLGEEALDPLEEFLNLALQYEQEHTPSLQGFLQWVRSGKVEIKRDMEQGMDAVRIMTVHGAKGLQAPIVFLPDTMGDASGGGSRIPQPFWFSQGDGRPVMLWSPRKESDNSMAASLREARRQEELRESARLLYVAMTRASDRLYIGGWLSGKAKGKVPAGSWYGWVESGLQALAAPCRPAYGGGEEARYIANPQIKAVPEPRGGEAAVTAPPLPAWLLVPPAPEPYPPRPLAPSRADDPAAAADDAARMPRLSPANHKSAGRFRRGLLVHRLLQFLPDQPPESRREAMAAFLTRYHHADMAEAERESLAQEIMAVLEDPALAPVFAPGSLAEVPLTGLLADETGAPRLLHGRIDRLCVTPEAVWIIDYKTGTEPPRRPEDIPPAYLRQMQAYRRALAAIYPGRAIHAALLWTSGPVLLPISDDAA